MEGKADYSPSPDYADALHLIGPPGAPVWIGRKGDVPGLFDERFWIVYDVWRRFNLGFGLPEPGPWTAQDQWLMDMVALLEEHYRAHFCADRAIMELIVQLGRALLSRGR